MRDGSQQSKPCNARFHLGSTGAVCLSDPNWDREKSNKPQRMACFCYLIVSLPFASVSISPALLVFKQKEAESSPFKWPCGQQVGWLAHRARATFYITDCGRRSSISVEESRLESRSLSSFEGYTCKLNQREKNPNLAEFCERARDGPLFCIPD